MTITVNVTVTHDNETSTTTVTQFQRDELKADTLGLTLTEAKNLLQRLQKILVSHQIDEHNQQQCHCPDCQQVRSKKDTKSLTYRTLFAKLELESPRFYTCSCQPREKKSESPLASLLTERSSPELLYLQTKWASLMSYGLTTDLMNDVLPITICDSSVRHQVQTTAQRSEDELGPEQVMFIEGSPYQWEQLPDPNARLFVGMDGGYIQAREGTKRKAGWFEAIVGKSLSDDTDNKSFGLVTTYDEKPKRRVYEMLQAQGFQLNQNITFLSDGGDTVRDLQRYLSPQSEHILDWFHITMRFTVMRNIATSLPAIVEEALNAKEADRYLESAKWYLWHGNTYLALENLDLLEDSLVWFADDNDHWQKLHRKVEEFIIYIRNNEAYIPNYGERYLYDEPISTAFVESAVNHIISKRFVKKQQMRWTKRGAHLLLQMRTKVLDGDLQTLFQRWYPNMSLDDVDIELDQVA